MTKPSYSGRISDMSIAQILRQARAEIKYDFTQKKARKAAQS